MELTFLLETSKKTVTGVKRVQVALSETVDANKVCPLAILSGR